MASFFGVFSKRLLGLSASFLRQEQPRTWMPLAATAVTACRSQSSSDPGHQLHRKETTIRRQPPSKGNVKSPLGSKHPCPYRMVVVAFSAAAIEGPTSGSVIGGFDLAIQSGHTVLWSDERLGDVPTTGFISASVPHGQECKGHDSGVKHASQEHSAVDLELGLRCETTAGTKWVLLSINEKFTG
eukprot:2681368-Amphidinium_carterae.1